MPQANNPARSPRQEAQITELSADSTREVSGRHHRRGARAAVELDVSLGSDHNFYAGFVENLSAGGVFVATHLLRPVGDVIELSIYISDGEEVVRGTGEVRWLREYNEASDVPPGMGVKFISLAEGADKIIKRFLAQRDPLFFDDDDDDAPEQRLDVPAVASSPPEASAPVASEPPAAAASEPPAAASEPPAAAASAPPAAAVSTVQQSTDTVAAQDDTTEPGVEASPEAAAAPEVAAASDTDSAPEKDDASEVVASTVEAAEPQAAAPESPIPEAAPPSDAAAAEPAAAT